MYLIPLVGSQQLFKIAIVWFITGQETNCCPPAIAACRYNSTAIFTAGNLVFRVESIEKLNGYLLKWQAG